MKQFRVFPFILQYNKVEKHVNGSLKCINTEMRIRSPTLLEATLKIFLKK